MAVDWISQLCRSHRAPDNIQKYRNAAIGILFVPLNQLLVVPLQLGLNHAQINLPSSILVMMLASVLMLFANMCDGSTASFYSSRMKGPVGLIPQDLDHQILDTDIETRSKTDFLGRHMSFGFVASFVMLSKEHIDTATDIPKIAGAFVVTSILSYAGSYLFAAGSFQLERRLRGLDERADDIESTKSERSSSSRFSKRIHRLSVLATALANNKSHSSLDTMCSPPVTVRFVVKTAPLWISLCLLLMVGLPIYCATGYDMPFEALVLVVFWIGTALFQRSIKSSKVLELWPRLRSAFVVFLNPVLLTSALGTIFFWIKTAVTHQSIDTVLGEFRRHHSWAEIFRHLERGDPPQLHIGAGDLAGALLDAGIVSLGFKMFEYRRELWRSFTTVVSTSLVFAAMNIFLNVLFAKAMGLRASDALAFAARNVTIALGIPAVQNLSGSTTLMSALVVFSGMLFQMTGDLVFSWLGIHDSPPAGVSFNAENGTDRDDMERDASDCRVVAAGVAVGINAAAMGTAHLIERDSRATAYSALSMTIFGVITVALTAIPAIAEVLMALASR